MKARKTTTITLVFGALLAFQTHAATKPTGLDQLLESTGVVKQIESLKEFVIQSSQSNVERCGVSPAPGTALPSFNHDSILYDTLRFFDPIDPADMGTLLDWYQNPLALSIHNAEQGNYDPDEAVNYQSVFLLQPDRVNNIKRIINNTRTNDFIRIIGTEIEYAGILHSDCIDKAQSTLSDGQLNPERVRANLTRDDKITAQLMANSIIADLGYLLRDLSDSELERYADFTSSAPAKVFYNSLINALDQSIKLASDRIDYQETLGSFEF